MTNNGSLKRKGLTATVIIEAESLNYDEGFKNVAILKKIRRADGAIYTFASRQSLRYSIVKQGVEQFGWKLSGVEAVGKGKEKVIQHQRDASLKESEEIDLFGYMKTGKGEKDTLLRLAPVRLTPAIALEPFSSDIEFMNNKWMFDRLPQQEKGKLEEAGKTETGNTEEAKGRKGGPNIANIEHHRSLYKYTVTIDLDRIGTEKWNWTLDDQGKKVNIEVKTRAERIGQFLEILKTLYRDIKGRREDLKPLFIIGGVYDIKNPFFMNVVTIDWQKGKPVVLSEPIQQILGAEYYVNNQKIQLGDSTVLGIRAGIFGNEKQLVQLLNAQNTSLVSPESAIDDLRAKVESAFGVEKQKNQS